MFHFPNNFFLGGGWGLFGLKKIFFHIFEFMYFKSEHCITVTGRVFMLIHSSPNNRVWCFYQSVNDLFFDADEGVNGG